MAEPLAQLLGRLDVELAEHALARRSRAEGGLERRGLRDVAWIRAALARLGQAASDEDIRAALESRPGRFLPGTPARALIRGMRGRIDEVERAAERGEWPGLRQLREHAAQLGFEVAVPAESLRPAFHLAEKSPHPVRRVAGFAAALHAALRGGHGEEILLHLVAAQMLLAQGYPVVWLGPSDWDEWCRALESGAYDGECAFARSVRGGIDLHL